MTLSSRTFWIIGIIAAAAIGWIAVVSSGADYPSALYVSHFPDLASDKYTALAALATAMASPKPDTPSLAHERRPAS